MSSIYYPSINEFWPAVRARNFVRALGGKPTKYVENMAILARRAGVHPEQMYLVNPLTFAERHWNSVHTLLDKSTVAHLSRIRQSTWHGSAKWFYETQQPIPPYVPSAPVVKKWRGLLPYINDADLALFLAGERPKQATSMAIFNMEQCVRNCGIATYMSVRKTCAAKGYFEEELFGYARIPHPFPIDLHSDEGLFAFAAGAPLPHPMYLRDRQLDVEEKAAAIAGAVQIRKQEAAAAAAAAASPASPVRKSPPVAAVTCW
jgi:hypothetical protein